MSTRTLRIAVIAGDGIGPEVIEASVPLVERAAAVAGAEAGAEAGAGVALEWVEFPWGCDFYNATGRMMPEDGLEQLASFDAIYFGAVGRPDVPDHISVWELILPIR